MNKTTLDTTGLKCPLPVLKARKALKSLTDGDLLEVLATDPGSRQDFKNFCDTTGDSLLEQREETGVFTFLIRKGG